MVRDVVEDDVVPAAGLGEVVGRVVDDVVGADRPDELEVARAGDGRDLGTERFRDLDRERADPARGAVDEDRGPRPDVGVVAECLEGDEAGHRHGGGRLEGEVGGLEREGVLGRRRCTRRTSRCPAEDLIARLEMGDGGADRFDRPGDIRATNDVLGLAEPVDRAGDVRQPAHDRPVGDVDARGPDADQDLVLADRRLLDVACMKDGGGAVGVLDDGLHDGLLRFTV